MDKNLIIAFLLIFASFAFFSSSIYNEKILGNKPAPAAAPRTAAPADKKTGEGAPPVDSQTVAKSAPSLAPAAEAVLPSADTASRTIVVIGKLYSARFTTRGALAVNWTLAGYYRGLDSIPVNLLPEEGRGLFNLTLGDQTLDNNLFDCAFTDDTLRLQQKDSLVFRSPAGAGYAEKVFRFDPESYQIDIFIRTVGVTDARYRLGWSSGIIETELDYSGQYADNPVTVFYGDDVDYPVEEDDSVKVVDGLIKWISLKSKYFSGNFIPPAADNYQVTFRKLKKSNSSNNDLNFSFYIEGKLENNACQYQVILCPNKYSLLKSYGQKLEKILFKGYAWFFKADIWFPPLCGLVLDILNFFYGLIPNYGVAIILLTILSKIVTFPLTQKSAKSMARMKLLQPKIEAIRAKHKADPMTMNKAIMKMYKEEGVSPLGAGGCLPMILQMPIFIALFVALRKAIELRQAPFMLWITDLSGPEAVYMLPGKILFFYGPNVSILTFIMAITMYFQSKQTMTDPRQKMMIYIMPVMMLFIMNNMPAGLTLYWSLSNVLGIIQNAMIKPNVIQEQISDKPKKKGGMFKPLSYNQMVKKIRGKS